MQFCTEHMNGGGDLPCPWPDCEHGTKLDRIERESYGTSRTFVSMRERLDSHDGRPRYFWRLEDLGWWGIATQIRNLEIARAERPIHTSQYVYHYTTLDAFQKIIDSQQLWLSDYAYLNDSSEVQHGLTLAREIFDIVSPMFDREEQRLFDGLFNLAADKQPRICVACFSFERDSLTQWKGYGANTLGVALGIDLMIWSFKIGRPIETSPHAVIYDDAVKRDLLRGFFHDWAELHRRDRVGSDPKHLEAYDISPRSRFYELLSMFKDSAFRDEREFRFVYQEDPQLLSRMPIKKAPKRFRVAGSVFVPYTTTKDLAQDQLRIDGKPLRFELHEVVVGPHPQAGLAAAGIREFLDSHGYANVPVTRSEVPFR
jgi:hypothetical protein